MFLINLIRQLNQKIWSGDPKDFPPLKATGIRLVRVTLLLIRSFGDASIRLRAMGLVYLTLMSVVPLLAITIAILKAFGFHHQLRDIMLSFVEPLGDQGSEVVDYILEFVSAMQLEGLGVIGVAVLVISVVSALQMVEMALNEIWHVQAPRRFVQRVSTYFVTVIVGPLLGFFSIAAMTALSNSTFVGKISEISLLGQMVAMTGRLVPFLIAAAGFMFLFMFMPNTRVRARSAFLAALISAAFWVVFGITFAALVVSTGRYAAVYSAFASLVLFMLWTFSSWMVVLIGARGSYLLQHPDYIVERSIDLELSIEQEERLSLRALQLIGRNFYSGKAPWNLEELAAHLNAPWTSLERILGILERGHFIVKTGKEPFTYLPGKPFEESRLSDVLNFVRNRTSGRQSVGFRGDRSVLLNTVVGGVADATREALGEYTLKDLALEEETESFKNVEKIAKRPDKAS